MIRIKMLETVGKHAEGSIVPVDDATGKKYIDAGFAEKAPDQAAEEKFSEAIAKGVADGVAKLFGESGAKGVNPLKGGHIQALEAEADKTKSFGDFLQCIGISAIPNEAGRGHATERLVKVYGSEFSEDFAERYAKAEANRTGMSMKAALAESSGITGGYTVPPDYANRLLSVDAESTVLVGKTDDYPMTGVELVMPVLKQTGAPPTGGTSFFAGVVMNWTAEAALRSESEPTFGEFRLKANELSGYALASRNVLMDNAVALEQRLTQIFREAIAWYRDMAYLTGDGVGKPLGITNAPCTLTVARATALQVNYADAVQMYGKLLPQSLPRAFWVMQQSVLQSFLQMKDGSNRLIIQPYFATAGGPAAVRPVMTMLGLPIITTEKVSVLGTAGDLLLVDPKMYFSGTRQAIEIAASEHYKFLNNQITYRVLFRGDGRPWLDNPITLQDGTTKVSPFIKLIDAA